MKYNNKIYSHFKYKNGARFDWMNENPPTTNETTIINNRLKNLCIDFLFVYIDMNNLSIY